uniref:BTB domain-containing protein n=1 Tax=Panagrellus redivivus TaxID=6233 RepID=A0A7E4VP78_PANRE
MHRFAMKNNSFDDSISLDVDESLLKSMIVGQLLATPPCTVKNADDLTWGIRCFPAGVTSNPDKVMLEFYLNQAPMSVLADFSIRGTDVKETMDRTFEETTTPHRLAIISHTDLLASGAIKNGVFVVRCDVTFKKPAIVKTENLAAITTAPLVVQSFIAASEHNAIDVELLIGARRIHAHRGFLSLISPVFHAMFTHDTKEAQSGVVFIEDFQFEAVEDAMNFCYGHVLENKNASEIIEALKFVEKYDIKAAVTALENWLLANLKADNVCQIAKYAWDHVSEKLQEKCGEFYQKNVGTLALAPEFVTLDANVVSGLVQMAARQV